MTSAYSYDTKTWADATGFTTWKNVYWNDRRSRVASRVPLFLLDHFPTNESEISDFCLYLENSLASYMKFWQQFEINELYVCTKI